MNLGLVGVAERNPTTKNLSIVGLHYVLAPHATRFLNARWR